MLTHPLQRMTLAVALSLVAATFALAGTAGDDGLFSLSPQATFAQDNDDGVTNLDDSESSVVTPVILYGVLIVVALAVIAGLVVYRQRRRHRPQDDEQDGPLTPVAERDRDAADRIHHSR